MRLLKEKFAALFRTRTRDEWTKIFEGDDACVTPVLTLNEAAEHPHNLARRAFGHTAGQTQPRPAPQYK